MVGRTLHHDGLCMDAFGTLVAHTGRHPTWPHRFNPYGRNRPSHKLDGALFDALLSGDPATCDLAVDSLFTGCINAPEDIPMGSTERVRTVGGYEREAYNTQPRGSECWRRRAVANFAFAKLLREILDEQE